MKKIGIIGGGFSGIMTAYHLINNTITSLEITIIDSTQSIGKGIAYTPYSKKHLLNVSSEKMSALPNSPNHFLEWVMTRDEYCSEDPKIISKSFLPRYLYGEYLTDIWLDTIKVAILKKIKLNIINDHVIDLSSSDTGVKLKLTDKNIDCNECIIATGNQIPRNPQIKNLNYFKSPTYFQNPWTIDSVSNLNNDLPILIIGNGLTMVDTVLGILENGFKNKIYSISKNGFTILPHRSSSAINSDFSSELPETPSLLSVLTLVNKHRKHLRNLGLSAESIIDFLRPQTQKIWRSFTLTEKRKFMNRLRHFWGVARHRIPLHIHDQIQQLQLQNRLKIVSGKIIDIHETNDSVSVLFHSKKQNQTKELSVSRVINCTGPETDLEHSQNELLKNCFHKELLAQDELKLGIKTDLNSFQTINSKGQKQTHIYTLGTNLKGELWESTAINEIRIQAQQLAKVILHS